MEAPLFLEPPMQFLSLSSSIDALQPQIDFPGVISDDSYRCRY